MRLSSNQINTIKQLSLENFNSNDVYIFGSRIDDTLKGGDIDIYIQTNNMDNILKSKIIFLREFEKNVASRK